MDRIEFEEWSLKALDPAIGPSVAVGISGGSEGVREAREKVGKVSFL